MTLRIFKRIIKILESIAIIKLIDTSTRFYWSQTFMLSLSLSSKKWDTGICVLSWCLDSILSFFGEKLVNDLRYFPWASMPKPLIRNTLPYRDSTHKATLSNTKRNTHAAMVRESEGERKWLLLKGSRSFKRAKSVNGWGVNPRMASPPSQRGYVWGKERSKEK